MKSLEIIKREYARERGFIGLLEMEYDGMIGARDVDEISKRYAKEVARESLRNASESARVMAEDTVTGNGVEVASWTDCDNFKFSISKTSILNQKNIPEL